ncbi:cell death abnormality protein 1 isoform X2 [Patella vulgata]|uniref:cell death abnormality protein 1 isoform X2 n=1 Tax=Patella vulgata TaxID=6465 RepID=UPI0024A8640C|nr:cell death abnormality protein 1 isoform X2 [Patella vulgata]
MLIDKMLTKDRVLICLLISSHVYFVLGSGSFNVALNKPTWQSSTYRSGVSSRAVDGNTNQRWYGNSCTETNNNKAREWLCVDLKQSFDISSMKIFNRIDGGTNNIKGFEVRLSSTGNCDEGGFISATACYKDHTSTGQSIYTIDRCNQPSVPSLSARFVFVSIKRQYLYICELQIFTGSFNVALNKPTWQSSTLGDSSNAVDGNTNQDWYGGSCTITNNKKAREWLCVDLKQSFDISSMKIFNVLNSWGTNYIKGFEVRLSSTGNCDEGGFISATACYKDHTSTGQSIYIIDRCNQPSVPSLSARFVFVSIKRQYLYICELQIFTENCPDGFYGTNCNIRCPANCTNNICEKMIGSCSNGCQGDLYGSRCELSCSTRCKNGKCNATIGTCTECKDGYYGEFCESTCNTNCQDNKCDRKTGKCTGCKDGYYGDVCESTCNTNCQDNNCDWKTGKCTGCKDGYYGDVCEFACNTNCQDNKCDRTTGECTGCKDGFYGDVCESTCNTNCQGNKCDMKTGKCTGCKDGYYGEFCESACNTNCHKCDRKTAKCTGCKDGFYGEFCESTCNTNCQDDKCNWKTGKCTGCKDGYYSDMCDESCPTCNGTCRQLDGVCLTGCKDGYWGCNGLCLQTCSYCNTRGCRIEDGVCHNGCQFGFSNPKCFNSPKNCPDGFYGTNCNIRCPANCTNNICEKMLGSCSNGCQGDLYGSRCEFSCSTRCKNGKCNARTGKCTGCRDGFYGEFCESTCNINCQDDKCEWKTGKCTGCKDGYYGEFCESTCNTNCQDNKCDRKTGKCTGCKDGFYGDVCESTCNTNCQDDKCERKTGKCTGCKDGYYGEVCESTCNTSCKNGKCNARTGKCTGCKDRYYSDMCEESCSTCNGTCRQLDGVCLTGCKDGYWGSNGLCLQKCSYCNTGGCRIEDGVCHNGCPVGFNNPKCFNSPKNCPGGFYGINCNIRCPANCTNNVCGKMIGSCSNGCQGDLYGSRCEFACSTRCKNGKCNARTGKCTGCKDAYYSDMCEESCPTCNGTCRQLDGVCLTGCKDGYWGSNGLCLQTCAYCNTGGCRIEDGVCHNGCPVGFNNPKCFNSPCSLNVALNKPTRQSSTHGGGVSSRAVDGNTNQDWSGGSCTHTNRGASEWLCVDLKQTFDISNMKIFNMASCCTDEMKGFEIRLSFTGHCDEAGFTSATPCYQDQAQKGQYVYTIERCNQPPVLSLSARYVFVSVQRQYLHICELQIFAGP